MPARVDEALSLIDENLKINPSSVEDQRAKARLLLMKPGEAGGAMRTLEGLYDRGLLSREDRMLLAQRYATSNDWPRARQIMLGLLQERNPLPSHLVYYANLLIDRNELDEAERRLATPPGRGSCPGYSGDHRGQGPAAQVPEPGRRAGGPAPGLREEPALPVGGCGRALRAVWPHGRRRAELPGVRGPGEPESGREPGAGGLPGQAAPDRRGAGICDRTRKTAPAEALIDTGVAILAAANPPSEDQQRRVGGWVAEALPAAARLRPLASQPGELAQPAAAV